MNLISKNWRLICIAAMTLISALSGNPIAFATDVVPDLIEQFQPGDAYYECSTYGCGGDYAYKFDNWDPATVNGARNVDGGNVITISNATRSTFDWSSEYPVCAVIVKASTRAYVFQYPGGSYGDTGLYSPLNPNNGNPFDISHVTFCYDQVDVCWEEETAWTSGSNYVNRGNWAMYSTYDELVAGVEIIADGGSCPTVIGTATLTDLDNGLVSIDIVLEGAIFYYDVGDPLLDNNLKVQDYSDVPPRRNPAPGRFDWKVRVEPGSSTGSIVVPANNFYGIHLDVALPCGHCDQ